ncbi:MAG: ABC transporter ATP-binding protein [Roseibacillus sp.]
MIELIDISWHAGEFSLRRISCVIPAGKYTVLMGRTGCGKTSVAELICGLRHPREGKILIAGREVTRRPSGERNIGYVPQDGALFPTMTVREQIGFGPGIRRKPRKEIEEVVTRLAAELGLEHLLDRKPDGLSGGERQRVALGRALAVNPEVLLLDEPLSALDEDTRDEMAELLKRIQTEHSLTALHITHSSREAEQLADCVLRMEEGVIRVVKSGRS